ncbi:MAG: methyltransferase domain-containing protein [Thermoplasmatota archaeon]
MSDYIVLINKTHRFVALRGMVNTHVGAVDASDASIGDTITAGDVTFLVARPTFTDLLQTCRRAAQVVTLKDAVQIVAVTGLGRGWRCVDGGSGSGFLALFLGHMVGPDGQVSTYERREDFHETVQRNIRRCGMEDVVDAKHGDIAMFEEQDLDLVTLDVKGAEELVERVHRHLKPGGWLAVYSPQIEQQIAVREEMEQTGFAHIATMETLQREWQSRGGYTRPVTKGLLHTGFMTYGRKVTATQE